MNEMLVYDLDHVKREDFNQFVLVQQSQLQDKENKAKKKALKLAEYALLQ